MNSVYSNLLSKIHFGKNPYEGFPVDQWAGTWYNDCGATRTTFSNCIDRFKPKLIVEVGSFVGESAIWMAKHCKKIGLDSTILCIDTWMGGIDHWKSVPEKLKFHFGRSSLFYQFMGNVIKHGVQDVILPLSMDSKNASRILSMHGINADMIYIDASHEEGDVLQDYCAYWPLLNNGGAFLVDDLTGWFPGVVADFGRFCKSTGIEPEIEGEKGLLVKP